jgi:trehalose-6-phosphate synthase
LALVPPLPRACDVQCGLLGADLLAFHTHGHLQHFRASLLRALGIDSRMDRVEVGARPVQLEALPIGIAPEDFTRPLEEDALVAERLAELRRRFVGRRLLLAKEYVACQTDGDAVLILSEFAGAAAEMGEAFIVNPCTTRTARPQSSSAHCHSRPKSAAIACSR